MDSTRGLRHRRSMQLALGMWVYAAASAALAQEAGGLEEIVVTARRAEESIQSVPVTVAAFSPEQLREASIATPNDLQFQTPGVFLQGSAAPQNAAYSIRGQGLSIAGFGLPGVITYFAEVPLPAYGSANPQYDMGSIQVLKGPQGTLFGRNTTGGAVLLTPAAPSDKFESYVQATVGNFDRREGEAMVNIPIGDKVSLRLAGHMIRQDGYTKNSGLGDDFDDLHTDDARVSLLLQPVEWLTNTTIFDYSNTETTGGSQVLYSVNEPTLSFTDAAFGAGGFLVAAFNGAVAAQQALGAYRTESDIVAVTNFRNRGIMNRTEFELGTEWNLSITNIFAYRALENFSFSNIDGLGATFPLFAGSLLNAIRFIDNEQYTDELQFRGEKDNVRWLLGAFYLNNRPDGPTGSQNTIFGAPAPASYRFYEEKSKAAYFNVAYELDDWLSGLAVNAGYRYTWDEAELCDGGAASATDFSVDEDGCRGGALVTSSTNDAEFTGATWTVGLDWQINDDLFAYITSRRGYRGGGINSPVFNQSPANLIRGFQTYKPDKVTDVELGLRSDWNLGDVALRFNASVFHSETDDAQRAITGLQTLLDPTNPAQCLSVDGDCDLRNDPFDTGLLLNYGDTTIQGVEAELTVSPIPSLALNVGGVYQDTETDSINPAVAALAPVLIQAGFDPTEVPFDATPEKTLTAGVRWELPLPSSIGSVVFNADYFWIDETQMVAIELPSYDITNVRVDWNDIMGMPLDFGVFARNVFDDEFVETSANPTAISPYFTVHYGPPRMYGAQLRYRFE